MNKIIWGDCILEMQQLEPNSVDAIITDPPYGIGFMGKEWDNFIPKEVKKITKLVYKTDYIDGVPVKRKKPELVTRDSGARVSGTYDLSLNASQKFQLWFSEVAKECLRVLKPGAFLLSFGGTRTYHRMTCGIEDAGFEIRDTIMWIYGSGFPKSLNIGKQIDKIQGNEREVVGEKDNQPGWHKKHTQNDDNWKGAEDKGLNITKGNSEWEGWGTALKPACEPIVVARKPLSEKNVALNVLKYGTGGINIDESRIPTDKLDKNWRKNPSERNTNSEDYLFGTYGGKYIHNLQPQGRFPSNIILDEKAGKLLDEQSGENNGTGKKYSGYKNKFDNAMFDVGEGAEERIRVIQDKGGASRFFYCAKASKSERNFGCEDLEDKESGMRSETSGQHITRRDENDPKPTKNNHPTVKPIALMEYLIKLVTRKGARVLDPFGGSGTTAMACIKLGRIPILIEKEEEYIKIAKARIKPYLKQTKLK